MVSYGLAYGMEAYGLGQRLNIPTDEAAVILDAYFVAFPNVKAYMDRTVHEARERGYTETLFGRRRPIPELLNSNLRVRQAGERQAMNAGIQGLAADIFKVALVRIDEALVAGGYDSRVVLQVHDEVIVEVPDDEHDVVGDLVDRDDARRRRTRRAARGQRVLGRHLGVGEGMSTDAGYRRGADSGRSCRRSTSWPSCTARRTDSWRPRRPRCSTMRVAGIIAPIPVRADRHRPAPMAVSTCRPAAGRPVSCAFSTSATSRSRTSTATT